MGNRLKKLTSSQLVIPLFALLLIIVFNLIRDASFFSLRIATNNNGNTVLTGNIISILNGASELAILAIGMTLVTASSRGQDISVGAAAAIAGSVFVRVLREHDVTMTVILLAFMASCVVAILFGAFNGALVAFFKIQPMIATLILFTAGRPIAYWINGGATPTVESPLLEYIGSFIPGIPIPTPILIVVAFAIIVSLALRFTNLGLYTQAVGINEQSARLNGINKRRHEAALVYDSRRLHRDCRLHRREPHRTHQPRNAAVGYRDGRHPRSGHRRQRAQRRQIQPDRVRDWRIYHPGADHHALRDEGLIYGGQGV